MRILLLLIALISTVSAKWTDYYTLQDIALPANVPAEVGGLTFDSEGTLYVCLRRGDVLTAKPVTDPKAFQWNHFASGFHNGCGIWAPEPGRILVSQMAELTEAIDTDRNGQADTYNRLTAGWGLSGNYHETTALCPDGHGGYYLAVGTASHNGPTFAHTQGDYSKIGRRGRNYSSVSYRGWVLHYAPDGTLTPFCSGFRMHNGIFQDSKGRLWCGDNQGDWKATTPLYHLEKGKFYGHPSSLVWDEDWPADQDPLATYRNDLDAYNKHRTLPAVQIPHKEINRSAADPIEIPASFSRAFAGQLLLADNNGTRLTRIMLDEVNGQLQGSCTHFANGGGLRSGNNRLRFSPDGKSLYIGQTVRGWGKMAEGLQRLTTKGTDPFDLTAINITREGFRLTFSEPIPVDRLQPKNFTVSSFTYQSKWTYGSPMEDNKDHPLSDLGTPLAGGNTVTFTVADLTPGRVYKISLGDIKSTTGADLLNHTFYYTANQLP